jgi:uncharacterized protein YbaA (DUF1428 family)
MAYVDGFLIPIQVAKVMSGDDMPFDMKRMSYGGFKVIVDEAL